MEEIKIKSYQYMAQYLLLLTFIVSVAIYVIGSFFVDASNGPGIQVWTLIMIPGIVFWLICILLIRFGCITYDIYSSKGVKRIRRNKVIFEIEWNNVEEMGYEGLAGMFIFMPCHLTLFLKKPIMSKDNHNYDGGRRISTAMSKKMFRRIIALIPEENTIEIKLYKASGKHLSIRK